jgi:hypothetical protein
VEAARESMMKLGEKRLSICEANPHFSLAKKGKKNESLFAALALA